MHRLSHVFRVCGGGFVLVTCGQYAELPGIVKRRVRRPSTRRVRPGATAAGCALLGSPRTTLEAPPRATPGGRGDRLLRERFRGKKGHAAGAARPRRGRAAHAVCPYPCLYIRKCRLLYFRVVMRRVYTILVRGRKKASFRLVSTGGKQHISCNKM